MSTDYCHFCDYDYHRCRGCNKPMTHAECGAMHYGTCEDCWALLGARG